MSNLEPNLDTIVDNFFSDVKISLHNEAERALSSVNHRKIKDPIKNLNEKFTTFEKAINNLTASLEVTGNKALQEFNDELKNYPNINHETAIASLKERIIDEAKIIIQQATKRIFKK